jgi:hypothetical protein
VRNSKDAYDRSYDEGYVRPGHGDYKRREKYPVHMEIIDPDSDLDDDEYLDYDDES